MTLPASDNFDRANGALGASWSGSVGSDLTIASNAVTGASGLDSSMYWNADTPTNNQSAKGTLTAISAGQYAGVFCRGSATDFVILVAQSNTDYEIQWYNGGAWTQIGSTYAVAPAVNDLLKITADGSTFKGYINGIERISGTNASAPASGSCGVYVYSNSAKIDTFEVDNLSASGESPVSTADIIAGTGTTTDRSGSTAWTNPGNIIANDGSNATAAVPTDYLIASNFNFSEIPDGATINGITVKVEASETGTGSSSYIPQLINGAATPTLIGTAKTAVTVTGTTMVISTTGGIADLWGATLTTAIVKSSNFGVAIWSTDTVNTLSVDHISISVNYTPLPITSLDLVSYTSTFNDITILESELVNLDLASYTSTINAISILENEIISLDLVSYTSTINDITILENELISLDLISYTSTINTITILENELINLDLVTFTSTINAISVLESELLSLDLVIYTSSVYDLTVLEHEVFPLDLVTYSSTFNDINILESELNNLDLVVYTSTINDLTILESETTSLDLVTYSSTINDITVLEDGVLQLDLVSYSSVVNDISLLESELVSLDLVEYIYIIYDVILLESDTSLLDLVAYSSTIYDISVVDNEFELLDLVIYDSTIYDITVLESESISLDLVEFYYVINDVLFDTFTEAYVVTLSRCYSILEEQRVISIESEERIISIEHENRTILIF